MSTITTLVGTDGVTTANSMTKINTNFANLNSDKIETSYLDTDTSLTANSDTKIATQKAVKTYIDTGGNPSAFTGVIVPYAGSSSPSGWLLCNGAAVSRTTYSALFAITGTTFGIGDNSTTFNLPDLRGRLPIGAGAGTKVATFASRASNVITVTGLSNEANNEFQTGQAVVYTSTGSNITGLTSTSTYYVVRVTNTTFSLATSLTNAQNGIVITLSSDGSGTQLFTQTLTTRTLGSYGGEENHAMSSTELLAHTHALTRPTVGAFDGVTNDGNTGTSQGTYSTVSSTGSNVAMNNMQPFAVLNYIIKT